MDIHLLSEPLFFCVLSDAKLLASNSALEGIWFRIDNCGTNLCTVLEQEMDGVNG